MVIEAQTCRCGRTHDLETQLSGGSMGFCPYDGVPEVAAEAASMGVQPVQPDAPPETDPLVAAALRHGRIGSPEYGSDLNPANEVYLDGNAAAVKGDVYRMADAHDKLSPHLDEVDIGRIVGRVLDARAAHSGDPCCRGGQPAVMFETAQEVFDAFCYGIISLPEARQCFGLHGDIDAAAETAETPDDAGKPIPQAAYGVTAGGTPTAQMREQALSRSNRFLKTAVAPLTAETPDA